MSSLPPWNASPLLYPNGTLKYDLPALPGIWEEQTFCKKHECVISDGTVTKKLVYEAITMGPPEPGHSKELGKEPGIGGKHDAKNMGWSGDSLYAADEFHKYCRPNLSFEKYKDWKVLEDYNSDSVPVVDAGKVVNAREPPKQPHTFSLRGLSNIMGMTKRGGERESRGGGDHDKSRRGRSPTVGSSLMPPPPAKKFGCYFRCRQVPGDGNCMFHSVALGLLGPNFDISRDSGALKRLAQLSAKLRADAVATLSRGDAVLHLQGTDDGKAREILAAGAAACNLTAAEYIDSMKVAGTWGGGPEILALANKLERPIHVYELAYISKHCPLSVGMAAGAASWGLRRLCAFGSPTFDAKDPISIVSANSRFPDFKACRDFGAGNHFLCLEKVHK
jgi:hypothetical protein